jgi:hypothetical protein
MNGFASKVFSAYLCGSPRLCGNDSRKAYKPQSRRYTQRAHETSPARFTSFDAVDVRLLRQSRDEPVFSHERFVLDIFFVGRIFQHPSRTVGLMNLPMNRTNTRDS